MSRDGGEMKLALRDNVRQRVVIADSVKYPVGPAITGNWAWLYGLPVIGMVGSLVGVIRGLHLAERMRDVHLTPIKGTERSRVHTGLVLFGLVMALRLAVVAVAIAAIRK